MKKLINPGRMVYAIGIAALGIFCVISKDFIVGRPPLWPSGFNINPLLADISGALLVAGSLAIFFNKQVRFAALAIAVLILFLSVFRHLSNFMNDWLNTYKAIALFGGSLIIAGSCLPEDVSSTTRSRDKETLRKGLVTAGSILIGIFFIAAGYAHFKFPEFVKDFIPAYIPFHLFLAYFCGICLFAGGTGLFIPQIRRWAALLSAIMLSGWFILLHIPRFIANINDPSDTMGLFESFTFAGILFTLAGILSRKL